jgi:heat shock protein HslJ
MGKLTGDTSMARLTLTAALILAACVQLTQAEAPVANARDWHLTEIDGAQPGYTATLNLGETGRVTGQAPCNRYFADLAQDGTEFKLGPIGATRMACLQIAGEAEYFSLLGGIEQADYQSGILILTGAGHSLLFVQPLE